jgi:hypothetical protein
VNDPNPVLTNRNKVLVAGWFSFERCGATAGDLMAGEVACEWLEQLGRSYDIALTTPFQGGVDWERVDPNQYTDLVFVCGPFQEDNVCQTDLLARFSNCRLIGLDVSMPAPLEEWNPFDLLLERDSSRTNHPEVAFLSSQKKVPVVGICLVEPVPGALDATANAAIQRLVESRELSVVMIDTRLDENITGLRTSAEVESLIARMDLLVTTRLHGAVLGLKNGVPVVAIDVDPKVSKLRRQMEKIRWPLIFVADNLDDASLKLALDYCLTDSARTKAVECCDRAVEMLQEVQDQFATEVGTFAPGRPPATPPSSVGSTSRIRVAHRERFSLESYPHRYKMPERESVSDGTGLWLLRVAEQNVAHLEYRADTPGRFRIAIAQAGTTPVYDIQLNCPLWKVDSSKAYRLRFRARADQPRSIMVGFSKAQEPWTNLGLYRTVHLSPEWQSFEQDFVAIADDNNARIHFDVGGCGISVEVSVVTLHSSLDGESLQPLFRYTGTPGRAKSLIKGAS